MKALRRAVILLATLIPLAGVLIFWTARLLTDRTLPTQFLSWIPPLWALAALAVLTVVWHGPAWLVRRWRGAQPLPALRWATLAALAAACVWVTMVQDRALGGQPTPTPGAPSLRIVHWNMESPRIWHGPEFLAPVVKPYQPDVLLFAVAMTQPHFESTCRGLPEGFHAQRREHYAVASRFPILRVAFFTMGLAHELTPAPTTEQSSDPAWLPPHPTPLHKLVESVYHRVAWRFGLAPRYFRASDPGHLMLVELDSQAELGRNLVIWYIDMPSDPLAGKWELAGRVREFLDRAQAATGDDGRPTLPPADVLIGDFNIPRGSASLSRITGAGGGLVSAQEQAGHWNAASWPRKRPLFHIDQAFTAPSLRVLDYRLVDPGKSEHFAQIMDVEVPAPKR